MVWFQTADHNTRVQKWRFKLTKYDYKIIYRPGRLNSPADALFRNPIEPIQVNNTYPTIKFQPEYTQTPPLLPVYIMEYQEKTPSINKEK